MDAFRPIRFVMTGDTGIADQDDGGIMIDRPLMAQEIGTVLGMATDAVTWATRGIAKAIGTGNQNPSAWSVTASAGILVILGATNDVAAVTTGTVGAAGNAAMVFTLVAQRKVYGIGRVAATTVDCGANDVR